MDLLTSLGVLVRRWYVVVPFLALTVAAAVLVDRTIEPSYTATGSVLFLAPARAADADSGRGNPYLAYGNLQIPANVVSEVVRQPQVRDRLRASGASASYVVGVNALSNAPIVVVTATGGGTEVRATARAVMAEVGAQLARLQLDAGAPESTLIRARPITLPERITPETGSRLRALAVLGFVGLTATVGAAFVTEALADGLTSRTAMVRARHRLRERARGRSRPVVGPTDEGTSKEVDRSAASVGS